jgi:hypothetical protein
LSKTSQLAHIYLGHFLQWPVRLRYKILNGVNMRALCRTLSRCGHINARLARGRIDVLLGGDSGYGSSSGLCQPNLIGLAVTPHETVPDYRRLM